MPDLILAIETSNPGAVGGGSSAPGVVEVGVALGRLLLKDGVEVLGVEALRGRAGVPGAPSRGGHDDDLMPAIERLCARVGGASARESLSRVGVSVGPGGYTGLRVACAAGSLIAESCGAACVPVPSELVVLETLPADVRAGTVAIALASKGDSAWIAVFAGGHEIAPGRLLRASDMADLRAYGVSVLVADIHLPSAIRGAAAAEGVRLIAPVFDAAACLRVAARLKTVNPGSLQPVYPREPDAVTLWRAREKPA